MIFRALSPTLLCSLIVLSCGAKIQYGSFKLKNRNRTPLSELDRFSSVSTLQCAFACNTMTDCTSFAFDGSGTNLCILSHDDEGSEEEATGFMHYVKTKSASITTKASTTSTTRENAKTTAPIRSTTKEPCTTTSSSKGPTSQITTKPTPSIQRLEIIDKLKNYTDAEKACRSAKMQLVTIKDKEASDNLEKRIQSSYKKKSVDCNEAWIGLKSVEYTDDPFQWNDGDYLKWPKYKQWVNWASGEPNEYTHGTKYGCVNIVTRKSGHYFKWQDSVCSNRYCFICE